MKVRDLIEKLQEFPEYSDAVIYVDKEYPESKDVLRIYDIKWAPSRPIIMICGD